MKEVHLYTDGSARGNPGPGGYGLVLELPGSTYKKEHAEGFLHTTNNRMELLAVIVGLELLKKCQLKLRFLQTPNTFVTLLKKNGFFVGKERGLKSKKTKICGSVF